MRITKPSASRTVVILAVAGALAMGCSDRPERASTNELRRAALADSVASRQASVLFLGDSITQCWNREGLQVWSEQFAPLGAMNLGISSETTSSLQERLADYASADPSAVVLLIGTNDTKDPANDASTIGANVIAVANRIRRDWPGARLLVVGILPRERTDGPLRQLVLEANRHIERAAEDLDFDYLDASELFVRDDGSIPESLLPDAVHLSPTGYELLAAPIREWIDQLPGAPQR